LAMDDGSQVFSGLKKESDSESGPGPSATGDKSRPGKPFRCCPDVEHLMPCPYV